MATKRDIKHLSEHERMIAKPLVYIGSPAANQVTRYIYDFESKKMIKKEIWVPEGMERLFLEALSNAGDHIVRSRQNGYKPGDITVNVSPKEISIYNTGMPFTIKKYGGNSKYKNLYIQELGFGVIGTSSNYDESNRNDVIGSNGVGIKLVNIYSKNFELEVLDGKNKLYYNQKWSNNMFKRNEPNIRKAKKGENTHTRVSFTLDFDRFDEKFKDGYTKDIIGLFAFHCSYVALTNGITVICNGVKFDIFNIRTYIAYIRGIYLDEINYITHSEWIDTNGKRIVKTKSDGSVVIPKSKIGLTKIDVCIYDTPDQGENMSFVNGLITYNGGVHEEIVMKKIRDVVIKKLNDEITVDGNKYKLNLRDLRPHVSVMVFCRLNAPNLRGQMKTYLNDPTPEFNIQNNKLEKMITWNLSDRLKYIIQAKQKKILSKTNGKKSKRVNVDKLMDAEEAGSRNSHKCILDLVEGNSAQNYSNQRSVAVNNGHNRSPRLGSLAFRGKPINVLNVLRKKDGLAILNENKEYVMFKKAMGFREGMDYRIEKNYKTLRYGKIYILADSDVDGKHIAGLILLMIWKQFLTFLLRGKTVYLLRTPIVRTEKGKQRLDFYTQSVFDNWKDNNNIKGWEIKYCKGLASSSPEEIKRDAKDPRLVEFDNDKMAEFFLRVAFDNDRQARKLWLNNYDPSLADGIEKLFKLKISKFIDHEMVNHAIVNTLRTLPGLDGLKEGQRKALYTAFLKWGKHKYLKTDSLVVRSQENTHYHYGPAALLGSIDLMPLKYTGSNNLPYFGQGGTAGSRRKNGKDAGASRYTSLLKMSWWSSIYKEQDRILWDYVQQEGEQCEPAVLLSIIPMLLINGQKGIGTGYSTFIPNYNPSDLCRWTKAKIKGETLPKITPWYLGFKGKIRVVLTIVKSEKDENGKIKKIKFKKNVLEPNINEFYPHESGRTMVTVGNYHVKTRIDKKGNEENVVIVTEIPIGVSINKYDKFLNDMLKEEEISDYKERCGNNNIKFKIYGMKYPNINKLKLESRYGLTNMTIIDENRKPRQFKDVNLLLEYWFNYRKEFYPKRIKKILEIRKKETKDISDKYKFVKAIVDSKKLGKKLGKTLVVVNESKKSILEQLKALDLSYSLLGKVRTISLTNTEEGLKKIENEMKKVQDEIKYYETVNPMDIWYKEIEEFEKVYSKLDIKQE